MIAGQLTKKNGYWYMIFQLRDEAGRPKQKWLATHLKVEGNKRRAEELLFATRREYTDLADMQKRNNGIFFSDYLTAWVKTSQGKVAVDTYEEYQKCIRNRIAPYFEERHILLSAIKASDILDYYHSLYAKGLTGNTVLHYHVLLRKALEEAKLRRLIADNPTDHIPRPQKEPAVSDCYSPEECRKLLGVLRGDPLELPITIAVLYGLRRSEVLGLRWGAIDFERGSITISHSVTVASIDGHRQRIARDKVKRKSSFRTLPLMPQVESLLRETAIQRYGAQELPAEDYICVCENGCPLMPDGLSLGFQRILAKNQLRRIRFHDLRHSCANLLISARVPLIEVQQWLGHSTISTTADLYAHLEYANKERNADTISRMMLE